LEIVDCGIKTKKETNRFGVPPCGISSEFGDINAAQNKANDIELGYALQLERVYALRTQNLMQQQGKDNK